MASGLAGSDVTASAPHLAGCCWIEKKFEIHVIRGSFLFHLKVSTISGKNFKKKNYRFNKRGGGVVI